MSSNATNLRHSFLRVLCALAAVALVCCIWPMMAGELTTTGDWRWELLTVFILSLPLVAMSAVMMTGAFKPSRTHVAALVLILNTVAFGLLFLVLQGGVVWLFAAPVAAYITTACGWICFVMGCGCAAALDHHFSKRAGYIAADAVWWQEKNIRPTCHFLAFVWFVAGGSLAAMDVEDMKPWLNHSFDDRSLGYLSDSLSIVWFLLIFFIAKTLPTLLIKLTNAPRTPQPPAPRRGFHLF